MDNVIDNASQSKSFEYKTEITGKTTERPPPPPRTPQPPPISDASQPAQPRVSVLNVEITIPLKYIRKF